MDCKADYQQDIQIQRTEDRTNREGRFVLILNKGDELKQCPVALSDKQAIGFLGK